MSDGTPLVIDRLVAGCRPVRRLRPPLLRAAAWLAVAVGLVLVVSLLRGFRPNLAEQLARPDALLAFVSALLTGVTAAVATFQVSIPGRARGWAFLPVPALGLWLASLGWGCISDWVRLGPEGLAMGHSFECLGSILTTSLPLGLVLAVMVRHAGYVRPRTTALLGALSVSALASAGVTFFHDLDTALMVLIWHVGPVLAIALASWLFGERLFSWLGVKA
ncbi:MAG TPA: DUF1109 domain-containing protein [Geminicoccaceae bacterium]|nr:DUF1109 domain-containing protein [Geminicoccus sp.]HMU52507.1 DUF1109 domain-containing protein [Geminicoccaceae bacterium]